MNGWMALAVAYHVASRLAYAAGVGAMLHRQERGRLRGGFERFRRIASWIMANDAVSFVVLCLVTGGTMPAGMPRAATIGAGALLVAAGIGVKLWAARSLDPGAYYWRDFFAPEEARPPDPPGPYRYLSDPMYTVGYLHAYGFALVTGSVVGVAAAVFDQLAILTFARVVERPHFERLMAARESQGPSALRSR